MSDRVGRISAKLPDVPQTAADPAELAALQRDRLWRERQEAAVLVGGEFHEARFMGGTEFVTEGNSTTARDASTEPERVLVRLLPVRQYAQFLALFADEAALIELACGKPQGWADRLTPESHLALAEVARELNFFAARAWSLRTIETAARIAEFLPAVAAFPNSAPSAETSSAAG